MITTFIRLITRKYAPIHVIRFGKKKEGSSFGENATDLAAGRRVDFYYIER